MKNKTFLILSCLCVASFLGCGMFDSGSGPTIGAGGAASTSLCLNVSCPTGESCNVATGQCSSSTPCSANTYSSSGYVPTGNSSCTACPGASANGTGNSVADSSGLYTTCGCLANYSWSGSSCVLTSSNTPCIVNSYSSTGNAPCSPCATGTSTNGQTGQTACSSNTTVGQCQTTSDCNSSCLVCSSNNFCVAKIPVSNACGKVGGLSPEALYACQQTSDCNNAKCAVCGISNICVAKQPPDSVCGKTGEGYFPLACTNNGGDCNTCYTCLNYVCVPKTPAPASCGKI